MNRIRILILEDDRDIIELVASVLDDRYECYAASNGMDGIKLALLGEPDLIICDIMMPVMDGWEFLRRLRKFGGFEKTPVIFLSALVNREHVRDGYKMGVALYLTKPIDPARLRRNIELFTEDHGVQGRPKKISIEDLLLSDVHRVDEMLKNTHPSVTVPGERGGGAKPKAGQAPDKSWTIRSEAVAEESSQIRRRASASSPQALSFMARAAEMVAAGRPDAAKPRLMIVESDHAIMQMAVAGLSADYEILEASDGIVALERAARLKPDLFVIEGVLPRMTGYQLTAMLRKNRDFYRAPIVFTSSKENAREQIYAQKLGIDRFLQKPYRMDALRKLLKELAAMPGFAVRHDRPDLGTSALDQVHVKAAPPPEPHGIAEMERRHLETQLKRQLH